MFVIDDFINAVSGANAAAQQADAVKQAMAQQQSIYNQQRTDQAPWLAAGQNALGGIQSLMSDPSSISQSPAYQFRMQQGQQALERSAAARGGLAGGGFMKGLDRYSQGLASDEYGNQFGRLAQLAGMGQSSAQNLGGIGSNFANSMSSLYGAQGNAQAAGTMAVGNGIAGAVRSVGNLATLGMGGGFSALGIPGMGGGGGGGGGINPGASSAPQSTGYIPTQAGGGANYGFNLPQLSYGG